MMGLPVAQRLCEAGHEVHVWQPHARQGRATGRRWRATVHDQPASAVHQADITISLLENGSVVSDVLFQQGAAAALRKGGLFIDMASIQPREARDHAARLGEVGVAHLDAPVSGGTVGAQAGTLAIMVGGKAADFQRAQGVFSVLGRATHVGPHGAGQLAKLANQMIVGITIGAWRGIVAGRQRRRRHGQSARSNQRRFRRQPHPATARPAHGSNATLPPAGAWACN